MEVVAAAVDAGGGAGGDATAPFARRDVREWSRLDRATGTREHARVESDRWTARSAAGQRAYGKVVDSRVRNAADGRAQAHSRRQLEVFRQQGPQGSFQLVRTSTTSVSSSSSSGAAAARLQLAFDNLQLPLNPLDVGPQRTRASVGRSGSIGARRPPSRQPRSPAATAAVGASKAADGASESSATSGKAAPDSVAASDADAEVDSLTAQVSRICRQLHAEAHRAAFGPSAARLLADASASGGDESDAGVVIEELSDSDAGCSDAATTAASGETKAPSAPANHAPATRRRSSSIEDLKAEEGTSVEENTAWSRASQVRRSLQFPSKIQERESSPSTRPLSSRLFAEDNKLFEGGKLKGLEAFESIFRRGANIAESVNKSMTHDREDSDASNSDSLANHLRSESVTKNMEAFMRRTSNGTSATNAAKRHSFVTVESLKEVRGRLRPLNSPSDEEPKQMKSIFKSSKDEEDNDDGIVTDDHIKHPDSESGSEMPPSKVKSYILGMEVLANNNKNGTRKPVLGTGSLESRTSSRTSSNGNNRSEEWYNRRKSYGFEQVHSQDANDNTRPNRLWEKNKVESSTDSGICRSSEAVSGLPWNRTSPTKIEEGKTFDFRKSDNLLKISHSIHIKKQDDKEKILEDNEKEEDSAFQRGRKTIVTLGNEFKKSNSSYKPNEDGSITVHNSIVKDNSVSLNGYRNNSEDEHRFKPLAVPGNSRRQSEPVTITIPIVSDESEKEASNVESKRLFFRQLSAGTSLSIESSDKKSAFTSGSAIKDNFKRGTWNGGDEWTKSIDNEMKRHSIAVDESKYVREGIKRFSNLHDSASKELANVSTSELVKRFAAMHAGKKDEGIFSNKDKYNPLPTGFNVSFVQNGEGFSTDDQNKKHKKVEFCKTEVHFAAESGRVNIVETDEKPPPSNPIRRRRRNSAGSITTALPAPDANKSNLPEIRFGDSPYEKQLLGGNEVTEVSEDPPSQPPLVKPEPTRPTVLSIGAFQKEVEKDDPVYSPASSAVAPPINQECAMSSYDEAVSEHFNITTHSSESMPRSILKNNRKPKPFILGASNDSTLESSDNQDEKWGVRLRPVQQTADNGSTAMWRSTVTLRSTAFDTPQQPLSERKDDTLITKQSPNNTETELQKMLKQLRPAGQRKSTSETDSNCSPQSSPIAAKKTVTESPNNSVQVTISSPMAEPLFSGWSVADRVKQVEEMKHSSMETKGYSTRINFGSGEATIVESGSSDDQQNLNLKHAAGPSLFQKSDKCKPMWLRREEKKQELQDAKNSNKGLVVRIGKSESLPNGEVHPSLITSPETSGSDLENRSKTSTTTTTITIDLSPSPLEDSGSVQTFSDVGKIKPPVHSENLQSPSLIMKTITKPSSNHDQSPVQSPRNSFYFQQTNPKKTEPAPQELKKPEPVKSMPSQLAALKELYYSGEFSDDSERADEEVRSYMSGESGGGGSSGVGGRGGADSAGGAHAPSGGSPETRRCPIDDSGSVVSGSWSRVRAFRHVQQNHRSDAGAPAQSQPPVRPARTRPSLLARSAAAGDLNTTVTATSKPTAAPIAVSKMVPCGNPRKVGAEPLPEEIAQPHVAMANAVLPSYDPNRLRRVETLVSTRSGQPKITSIALRYEGDQSEDRSRSKSYSSSTYSQHQSAWKNLEPAPSHSYLPPRSDEKVAVGFTYYKPKEVAKEQPAMKDDRRDRTYKIEKHKDRLHNDEKITREKVSPNREPLFSTERRSDSPLDPHRRSMSPPSKRPIGYTSPKKSSSPVALFEPERERSLSPSSKPHSKPETYFGDLKTLSTSTFSGTYRQESPRKSSKNYDQKKEGVSHQRSHLNSVTTHQRASVESSRNHCRTVPENAMNGHHSGVVETSAREERRRYNYESSTRSRSASRGRSLSPSKTVEPRKSQAVPEPETNDYDSPIYENIDDVLEESPAVRRAETDSAILEELTRAADQILQAVNGYTDEDSRASSDDDDVGRRHRRGRRGGRPAERMTTIAEAPAARRGAGPTAAGSSTSVAASRRAHQQRLAQQCSRLAAHNSSTSSIESLTRGDAAPRRSVGATAAAATGARALLRRERLAVEEARRKVTSGPAAAASSASKPSSRTARLLQRASSREMLLKAHASSSEDVMSGAEAAAADALAARKARAPRRLRAASSAAAATAKSSSLTSASSGGRRPSPAVPGPQQPLSAAAGRPRRREADVPKSKERSHGVRSDESRRRNSGRRDDDVTRLRGVRAAGPLHQHPTSSALITSSGGRERGASGQRRSAGTTRVASAAAAGSSSAAAAAHAAAAAATATGPSHAVTRKPSSSRSESLSYSNKISK